MRILFSCLTGLLLLSACGPAPVPHGKVGLWNFTTTIHDVNAEIPPAAKASLAMMGMAVPDSQTHDGHICMSDADVKQGALPPINPPDGGCTSKLTKNDAKAVTAVMTCTGSMKGTGQLSIAYADEQHYAGTYNFKGTAEGKPLTLASDFKATWAKADCAAVTP
jgi:hypothetical protein